MKLQLELEKKRELEDRQLEALRVQKLQRLEEVAK